MKFAVNQSRIQVVGYALYCKCGADASNMWNARARSAVNSSLSLCFSKHNFIRAFNNAANIFKYLEKHFNVIKALADFFFCLVGYIWPKSIKDMLYWLWLSGLIKCCFFFFFFFWVKKTLYFIIIIGKE